MSRSSSITAFISCTFAALLMGTACLTMAATHGAIAPQQSSASIKITATIPPLFQVISSGQEANHFCAASKADHPVRVTGHYQHSSGQVEKIDQKTHTDRFSNCNKPSSNALQIHTMAQNQGLLVLLFMAE